MVALPGGRPGEVGTDGWKSWDGALGHTMRRMWRKGPGVWVFWGWGPLGVSPKAVEVVREAQGCGKALVWWG